jgi:hypothetical protein
MDGNRIQCGFGYTTLVEAIYTRIDFLAVLLPWLGSAQIAEINSKKFSS